MVNCVVHDWQGAESGQASFDLKTANEENAPHIVHRASWRMSVKVQPRPRLGLKLGVGAVSPGVKREQVAPVQGRFGLRYGGAAVCLLGLSQETTPSK
jgi:hypothetical protein